MNTNWPKSAPKDCACLGVFHKEDCPIGWPKSPIVSHHSKPSAQDSLADQCTAALLERDKARIECAEWKGRCEQYTMDNKNLMNQTSRLSGDIGRLTAANIQLEGDIKGLFAVLQDPALVATNIESGRIVLPAKITKAIYFANKVEALLKEVEQ